MALLGLDFFESKKDKELKNKALNNLFFPYGDKQRQKVEEILIALFPDLSKEEAMFNYIVTKQKLIEEDCSDSQLLISELKEKYMNANTDPCLYIVLSKIDLCIDANLNYPSIDQIKSCSI